MTQILSRLSLRARITLANYYHQKLFALNVKRLRTKGALPPFSDYSITPDFANTMIAEILEHKPKLIVEAGSGLSTIIAAYCLKRIGRGLLISLEHQKEYWELSQRAVLQHQLQTYVRLVHAPLEGVKIGAGDWIWYEPLFKEGLKDINMLIVDGPPGDLQPLSRYPMLPMMFDLLSDGAIVLMDDGARPDEQEIAARWSQEFGCFETRYFAGNKGLIRLTRCKKT
jgi:predicted O-methyltransferase YrrM